jgi:hypothetical protein
MHMATDRHHPARPIIVPFLLGICALGVGWFLTPWVADNATMDAFAGQFNFRTDRLLGDPTDQSLRQTLPFRHLSTRESIRGSDRGESPALPIGPPAMREVGSYSGSDPARPDRNASLDPDDHRTDILRLAALAHRRPYGELPRYVRQP